MNKGKAAIRTMESDSFSPLLTSDHVSGSRGRYSRQRVSAGLEANSVPYAMWKNQNKANTCQDTLQPCP